MSSNFLRYVQNGMLLNLKALFSTKCHDKYPNSIDKGTEQSINIIALGAKLYTKTCWIGKL